MSKAESCQKLHDVFCITSDKSMMSFKSIIYIKRSKLIELNKTR